MSALNWFFHIFLFSLIHFILYANACENVDEDELIFAHTFCRHGDRNIKDETYAADPYRFEILWPRGFAELTNVGIRQHYKLGQYFRKRYRSLLGNGDYSANKVYIRTTDRDRVLTSAQANMAGLFPPHGHQVWKEGFNWQPIPIHSLPHKDDYILHPKKCKHFDYIQLQYMNTTDYTDLFTRYAPLITYLRENTGEELNTINSISDLWDVLHVERLKGKTLPDWANNVMMRGGDFELLGNNRFKIATVTPEMKKLRSGYLLKEILDRFTDKIQSKLSPDRNLWMYFGHEGGIAAMLDSLGVFKLHRPPYASCILFELRNTCDGPYVQIFYKKTSKKNLPPLNLPECGTKCPLNRMYEIYQDILPTQSYKKECALREGETLPPDGDPEN